MEERIDELNLIKLNNFFSMKDTVEKMKTHHRLRETITITIYKRHIW